jgi:endonuclease III
VVGWRVSTLSDRLDRLEAEDGPAPQLPSRDGWELVLAENVAYLVDDVRRWQAMDRLRATTDELLAVVTGMQPATRVARLRRCAELALADAPWRDYPSIGPPGVERIRLFTGQEPVLALESNGLRVLQRWGYGIESANYGWSYRSAQRDAAAELEQDLDVLVRAHQLLRRHGMTRCRRTGPECVRCPVRDDCPWASRR